MTVDELKSQLQRFGIKPNHRLGQNFLLSEEVIDKIITAADISSTDTVLEIGPGLGVLTRKLGERAGLVLAVEKDRKIAKVLHRLFRSKKNVKIVQGDALFINAGDVIGQRGAYQPGSGLERGQTQDAQRETIRAAQTINANRFKVVANIPYYITGKLLRNFLQGSDTNIQMHPNVTNTDVSYSEHSDDNSNHSSRPSLMVLMLQREVAERIVAKPGQHSILSITTQFYAKPEIVTSVPRDNFYPVPDVDSAVVRLKVYPNHQLEQKWRGVDEKRFFQLVKLGFSSKRKMLKNNLKSIYKGELPNQKARAQDLSLADWKNLYELIQLNK